MERITFFADVILPLRVKGFFTYRIPHELSVQVIPGQRVVVQFGKQKIYSAIVRRIHSTVPKTYDVKYILSVLDPLPVVNEIQLKFWEWMAEYYMCSVGEVMNAALPPALKLESETRVMLHPSFDKDYATLNEKEFYIVQALEKNNVLTLIEASKIVEQQKVIPLIKTMIEKNIVMTEEELEHRYKPKTESYVRLTNHFQNEENLKEAFSSLEKKAYKQLQILISYIGLSKRYSATPKEVQKDILVKDADTSSSQLNALIKKGIFEIYEKEISRLEKYDETNLNSITLSEDQEDALLLIKQKFIEKDVVLLHGITSSGKTEIYTKLINETLEQGKEVLFLLPEIAITAQMINRLRKYLGDIIGIYHSKFNINERYEIWNHVLAETELQSAKNKHFHVVIGARSALFLPFSNLGLVIVDEEHETSYKQHDPSPRYNARDSAIFLASLHNAKTIIGSATPSIESYFNAKSEKYGLVELQKRYGDFKLPEIIIADVKEETKRKRMKSHFSPLLLEHIETALKNKEQIIIFQNRRGFSLRIECNDCTWTPQCKHCDVTLTYHKHLNQLRCHYCGYFIPVPTNCPVCKGIDLKMKGFGTEKLEEEIPLFFPEAKIARLDYDTTQTKHAFQKIINDFEDRKVDILIGTQMVTKGLDFDNVSVVGIMSADSMLTFPDFRSFERSYQLMAQVSGRAGRKNKNGKVIIQTYNTLHRVITYVCENNYSELYLTELQDRKLFKYPPFYRLIKITLKHKTPETLNDASRFLTEQLRLVFGGNVIGPEYPLVSRIRNMYLKNILLKTERENSFSKTKNNLENQLASFKSNIKYKSVMIQLDIDPI